MLGKMIIRDRDIVWALQLAKLEIMSRYHCDIVRSSEMADGLAGANDAVGRIRSFKNLIDTDEHGQSLLLEFNHAFDAQQLGIEGGKAAGDIIGHTDGSVEIEPGKAHGLGADGSTGIGEHTGTCKCAQISCLTGHVRPRDDACFALCVCIVRDGRFLR